MLDTLSLLLEKVGNQLRPFVPQLQQTFLRSLSDGHKQVRLKGANGLRHLVSVHSKGDPVFQEVVTIVKNSSDDSSVRETGLYALRLVISSGGEKMSDGLRRSILSITTDLLRSPDDNCRIHSAACLGALCRWLSDEELARVTKEYLVNNDLTCDWVLRHGSSIALRVALSTVPDRILTSVPDRILTSVPDRILNTDRILCQEVPESVIKTLSSLMTSDRVPLVLSGLKGTAYLFKYSIDNDMELNHGLMTTFARVSSRLFLEELCGFFCGFFCDFFFFNAFSLFRQ